MIKKVLLVAAVALSSTSAFATASNGYYLGMQLGAANADYSTTSSGLKDLFGYSTLPGADIQNTSFAGRVYMGYQWNKFLAAELGYNYLGKVEYNNIFGVSGISSDLVQQAGDLTAKVMLPVTRQFNVFALGGVGYVWAKSCDTSKTASNLGIGSGTSAEGTFTPVYGLGAAYDFNQRWGVDVSWRRYIANGDIEQTDLAAAGVSVHF